MNAGKTSSEELFRSLLTHDWLRPERAVMKYFKLASLGRVSIEGRSLDLSCGDGSLMFLHFGGRFDETFDHFLATRADEFSHDKFVDIFDVEGADLPPIAQQPSGGFDVGADWKKGLLDKARHFGAYQELVLHDNNEIPLPFDDGAFETIHSNAVYWMDDVPALLRDMVRITKPGGKAVFQVMTPELYGTLDRLENVLPANAVSILDRNRRATAPSVYDYDGWSGEIEQAGFQIESVESVFPAENLLDIWNIGLRPIAHLLTRMANTQSSETRMSIRAEWVDIFYEILGPMVVGPMSYQAPEAPYLQFIARRPAD